jgi:hypothetical protein
MGVRYSGKRILYSNSVRSDSAANMRADLDALLSRVAIARAAVTGGFKYTLQSPDGLQVKIWVQDLSDTDGFRGYLRVTPTSADESYAASYALLWLSGDPYEIWTNPYQVFIAMLGDPAANSAPKASSFGCGIPALPSGGGPCSATGALPTITDLWWSSVGVLGSFFTINGQNFRNSRFDNVGFALYYNGASYTAGSGLGPLGMMPLCQTRNPDYAYESPAAIARYSLGTGLRIDPLIALGPQVYGQLWDAHFYTLPQLVDTVVTLQDTDSAGQTINTTWSAWNSGSPDSPSGGKFTVLGTLFLLLSAPETESVANIAY